MKRMRMGLAIAAFIALSATATGAGAQQSLAAGPLTVLHQPATAFERQDAHIAAGIVSDCAAFYCGQVQVSVVYESAGGAIESVSASAPTPVGQGLSRATIPADDLATPRLSYHFVASQVRCGLSGGCEHVTARAPSNGSFEMAVGKAIGL